MKASIKILTLTIFAWIMSSCAIIKGLTTDGKYGPNIFSFEHREHDTIANGSQTFQFPVSKRANWIDTLNFSQPHCESKPFGEEMEAASTTQGWLIIHNDSIVYEKYCGDF